MGGDNAPESAVWGGALAAKEYGEEVLLVGDPDRIAAILQDKGMAGAPGVAIAPASELVDMHDDPATVLRHKPDSSMAVAFKLLKAGEGDALVSAGNTGALLTGATLYGGRIKGIRRGALAPVMPCKGGQVMLCDAGANTECTAEMLLQFAFLGSLYAEKINGVAKPRVGLVNNGTEDTKGDPLRKEAYALLKKAGDEGRLNFGQVHVRGDQGRVHAQPCDQAGVSGLQKGAGRVPRAVQSGQGRRRALPGHRKAGHQGARLVERDRGDERRAAGDRLHEIGYDPGGRGQHTVHDDSGMRRPARLAPRDMPRQGPRPCPALKKEVKTTHAEH